MPKDKRSLQFPLDLAADLDDATRRGLHHPHRCRVLRALEKAGRAMSPTELARSGDGSLSVSTVSYHLAILQHCGLADEIRPKMLTRGRVETYFASSIGDSRVIRKTFPPLNPEGPHGYQ